MTTMKMPGDKGYTSARQGAQIQTNSVSHSQEGSSLTILFKIFTFPHSLKPQYSNFSNPCLYYSIQKHIFSKLYINSKFIFFIIFLYKCTSLFPLNYTLSESRDFCLCCFLLYSQTNLRTGQMMGPQIFEYLNAQRQNLELGCKFISRYYNTWPCISTRITTDVNANQSQALLSKIKEVCVQVELERQRCF